MQPAPAPRDLEALDGEFGKMAWGSGSTVRISRSALALLERMSREPSVYSSLSKVKEQVSAGGLVIVDQKGQTPVHPLLQTCELNAVHLSQSIVDSIYKQGFCLLQQQKHESLGAVYSCLDALRYDISFSDGPEGRTYSCRALWQTGGDWGAQGGLDEAPRDPPVVVVEYPPYRPNSEGMPNSPMASLLEVYALRLQLENTRLAYTLDHALDAVLLARRRQGNVDRIYEEAWLHSQPKWELGVSATAGPPIPNTRTDSRAHGGRLDPGFAALEQARLAFLQEVRAPPVSQYAGARGNDKRRGLRSTASLAGLNVARDNSSVVYSRQAVRPEQEVSHALWHSMVLRVFSIPSVWSNNESSGAAYPRAPRLPALRQHQFDTDSFYSHTEGVRDFVNLLLRDIQAMVLPKRMQALEAAQEQQRDATAPGVGSGGADLGLAEKGEDEEAVLASYWWDLSLQPVFNPGSFTGLLELIRLRSTLSSHLDQEVCLVQSLYNESVPHYHRSRLFDTMSAAPQPQPQLQPQPQNNLGRKATSKRKRAESGALGEKAPRREGEEGEGG